MFEAQPRSRPMPPVMIKDENTVVNKDWKKALRSAKRSRSEQLDEDKSVDMKSVTEKGKKKERKAVKAFYPANQKANDERENFVVTEGLKDSTEQRTTQRKTYLDNLAKFQRDSKLSAGTISAFQRSPVRAQETDARDNFRRSFRSASTQAPKNPNHFLRQSLRGTRNSKSVNNSEESNSSQSFVNKVDKKSAANETIKSSHAKVKIRRPSSEDSKIFQSDELNEPPVMSESRTSSRGSTASSGLITSESSTSRPSSGFQRSLSRAEAAMEKHKERMRKASLPMSTQFSASTRQQTTPKMKRRNQQSDVIVDDVKATKPKNSEADKTKKDEAKTDYIKASKTHVKSSMATWNSVNVIEVSDLETKYEAEEAEQAQNSFDLLDIRSPMIRKKNPIKNTRKQRASKNLEQRSSQEGQQQGSKKRIPFDSISSNKLSKETHNDKNSELISATHTPSAKNNPGKSRKTSTSSVKFEKEVPRLLEFTVETNPTLSKQKKKSSEEKDKPSPSPPKSPTHSTFNDSMERFRKLSMELETNKHIDQNTPLSDNISRSQLPPPKDEQNAFAKKPHILSISNVESTNHISETKTKLHNNELRKLSTSGSSSETKETKKRDGAKKAKKAMHTAQRSDEKEKPNTIADSSVSETNAEAVVSDSKSPSYQSKSSPLEKFDCDNLLSEKLTLDLEVKPSHQKRASTAPTKHREDKMSLANSRAPIASRSFRLLSASQRREKLRRVLLKYRKESDSDSPLSEGSEGDSDIDMKWLEDGENDSSSSFDSDAWINSIKPVIRDTPISKPKTDGHILSNGTKEENGNHQQLKSASQDSEKPKFGSMKTMWENKTTEPEKPYSSPATAELEEVRSKVGETKARLISQSSSSNISTKEQQPVSNEVNKLQNGEAEDDTTEAPNVGSMLSMWENRKAKQHSAYNATKDEAFDSSTMGRLKGAKALFESMSKNTNGEVTSPTRQNGSVKRSTSSARYVNVKNIFENTSPTHNMEPKPSVQEEPQPESPVQKTPSPTIKSRSTTILNDDNSSKNLEDEKVELVIKSEISPLPSPRTKPRKSRDLSSGDWLEDDDDLSDVASLSSTTTFEDEEDTSEMKNIRSMWERKSSQKNLEASPSARKPLSHETNGVASEENDATNVPSAWEDTNTH